jgi:sec-independent protein translocase protein TatA
MKIGGTELLVILIIVLVIFGGGKLAGVGSALGKAIKDFKKEVKDAGAPGPGETDISDQSASHQ